MPFMFSRATIWSGLTVMLTALPAAAERNEALATALEAEVPAIVETVRSLAMIESGSDDAEGLGELAGVLEGRLQDLGFEVARERSAFDVKADSLVAVKGGSGRRRIMLMAHMDTIYPRGVLEDMPVRLEDSKLFGPGVVDAKGGIAVILHGLEILEEMGWDDYGSLTVFFNPDEETGSAGSGPTITSLSSDMDVVLSFESGGSEMRGFGWILAGTAAYAQVTMEVHGRASHAGTAPEKGRNAVLELSHQLLQTKDVAEDLEGVQLNWTNILSQGAYNQIPASAVAIGDARVTEDGAEIALRDALREKVAESRLVPDTETTVSVEILRPGFRADPGSMHVAELAQAAHGEISRRQIYIVPMINGATDAGYAAVSGNAVVLEGFGPWGADYHSPDEYLDVNSLAPTVYQFVRVLEEIGKM